jgi:ribosomal protein S18 acetylase RimI-like enzyme
MSVVEVTEPEERQRICARVLNTLPDWFGILSAVDEYIEAAAELPTFAVDHVAFLSLKLHTPTAAEIYVMGVRPERHRQKLGSALVSAAETFLRDRDVEFLQVKTLGPSRPDEHYERTRLFYEACGFRALEEIHGLWGESNPCLVMIKRL